MRWVARIVSLLLLAAGVFLAIALPKLALRLPGNDIERMWLYKSDAELASGKADLAPSEAPFFFTLSVRVSGPLPAGDRRTTFTVVVRDMGGAAVLDLAFELPATPARDGTGTGYVYTKTLVVDRPLDGRFKVELTMDPEPDPAIVSVILAISAGAFDLDPRLQPIGFILLVVGGVGLLLGFRPHPEQLKPAARWGRNGA